MSKITVCKTCKKEVAKPTKTCPYCGEKFRNGKSKFILGGFISLIVIIIIASLVISRNLNKNINLVKNGHLGNYKTVTISKVIDSNFKKSHIKWDNFKSEGKNIVELRAKDSTGYRELILQFSINSDNNFNVVHLNVDGQAITEPYDVKLILDGLYQNYSEISSDNSVIVDIDTSNDTLKGTK
ncbi:hypothetical protein [Desnuesiella massiliensis]|uniref:hypothetical protein n=1 Tax=Desnuesiella massiliensis TaxID=1650662 RepID=UPI0006E429F8|nr:hypothetical protein [Desnuesiella massiliensis]